MNKLLAAVIALAISESCHAKAYYAGKHEMIRKAECIAVVDICKVEASDVRGAHWTYRQVATARVESCLKGNVKGSIRIHGQESFICAQCQYGPGRFMVFLRRDGDLWVGSNWHLGIRPIRENMLPWFKEGAARYEMEPVPLEDVTSEVLDILEEQQKFALNTVWEKMSYDGTELTILNDAVIREGDYKALAENGGFMRLKTVTIHNSPSLTDAAMRQFCQAPVETLSLSGDTFSSEALGDLLESLPGLKSVNLSCTKLSDSSLARLPGDHLERLVIYNTAVTDHGLSSLSAFSKLSHLNLGGKNITNEGYMHLRHLHQLRELFTGYDGVTEDTFGYLTDLPLEMISLYDVNLSKKAMTTLGGIKTLKRLDLANCGIGSGGMEELKRQLTDIQVTRR